MHPGLAKPAVATPNPGWWMKTVLSASLPNENWTTATQEEAKPLKLTTWQICSLTESWQRMRGGAELRCVRNFHVEICTRRVSAVTNNNSTTAVAESLVQMKIWKRNSLKLFFPAVNSWRIEMLVIECNPWSGRVPSWKQKHDFKKCNFIALCLILRWSHSKPGVPARSLSLSQWHSRSNKVYFGPLFLTQHFCPFYGWCTWCIQGHEGIEFMWIQRTTTTGKATPMNTCRSTCLQNKHVDPSERFLEKNRYNTASQRLPQKTWIIQTSCSFLQNPGKLWWRRCLVAFDWVRGEQPCWRVIMLCYSLQNSWLCKIKQTLPNFAKVLRIANVLARKKAAWLTCTGGNEDHIKLSTAVFYSTEKVQGHI